MNNVFHQASEAGRSGQYGGSWSVEARARDDGCDQAEDGAGMPGASHTHSQLSHYNMEQLEGQATSATRLPDFWC